VKNDKSRFKSRYRPEIDGLRAFAVVCVIINHFNKQILPNGYLGVDIFFVISGFVITSSLYQRPSKNFKDFISGFYERRIRRLVPALSVFVLIMSITICLFDPYPIVSLRTGLTSLFGLSNLYLLKQTTDYFAQSTELNVFAHTWSLGVEEQFYILLPLIIWFSGFGRSTKNGTQNLFLIIGTLTIASLITFLYLYRSNQPAAYFLMPTRFWEMASGCLLFLGLQKWRSIEQFLEKIPPVLMMIFIIGIMYFPISWAKVSTFAVVLSSTILIASLKKKTRAYKFFTNPKIVYVGLISYSLYLWHWGVLSISRWTIGIHWWTVPFQVALMFWLAIISYKHIETPLRQGYWFGKRWKTLVFGGGVLAAISGSVVSLERPLKGKLYSGKNIKEFCFLLQRCDKNIRNDIDKIIDFKGDITGRIAKKCHTSDIKKDDPLAGANKITNQFISDCLSSKSGRPIIAFSGDSHSLSIFPISEIIASTSQYDVFSHSRIGCSFPPNDNTYRKCYEIQSSVAEVMIKQMSNRNNGSFFIATSYLNSHFGYNGTHRMQFKKHSDGSRNSVDKNLKGFIDASKRLAEKLKNINASLILVAPLPEHPGFTPKICSKQWFRPTRRDTCQKTERDLLERQRKHIVEEINALAAEIDNIYMFDAFDKFCDKKYCYVKKDNTYLFNDNNHLSNEGAILISDDLLSMINHINSQKRLEPLLPIYSPEN
tara:strand:+ start:1865 stop:3997 length:2133 start_codon:yes stop_codon:yes gene_type:complete